MLKVGDKVVCLNKQVSEDDTGVVGEIEMITKGCFFDQHIALVKYPTCKRKIDLSELSLYEPNHDDDMVSISRKQFRAIIDEKMGSMTQYLLTTKLIEIENAIFGDPGEYIDGDL